jgi:hypothetical protein
MRRIVALAMAIAIVGLAVSIATGAIASPLQGSASITKVVKRYAKKYAKQYAKPGVVAVTTVKSQTAHVQPGDTTVDAVGAGNFTADCPEGYQVIGTAYDGEIAKMTSVRIYGSFVGGFGINDTSIPMDMTLQAVCAKFSSASVYREGPLPKRAARAAFRRDNITAARSCPSGFTHANLPWGEKCLRRGEFCKRLWRGLSANRYYHRYGYHCKRSGHLGYY